jgi:hypothetical protein
MQPTLRLTRHRWPALALALALVSMTGLQTGCSTPIRITAGGQDSLRAGVVPDDHYAVYEVEITEPGVYALSVIDLDPSAAMIRLEQARKLNRIVGVLDPSIRQPGKSGQIGTDSFDDLAGVIWAVYGRAKGVAAAPATVAAPQPTPTAKPETSTLGARLMQSVERPLAEPGQRAPERARLEPGRYVVRVATAYGSMRTAAERVDVGLVRLADGAPGSLVDTIGSRVQAVPFSSGAPKLNTPVPLTSPAAASAPTATTRP